MCFPIAEEEINRLALLSAKVKNLWNTGLERFGELTNGDGSKATSAAVTYGSMENKKIVFVLSLAGRFATFVRFMKNYEEVSIVTVFILNACERNTSEKQTTQATMLFR